MFDHKTVLAIVPARSGSKGFPGKNLARLAGQSLVGRAISTALESKYIDRVILSSDSQELIAEGLAAGAEVPFVRPAELATDDASTASTVRHVLTEVLPAPHFFVLLQPTSPLRTAADIDDCIAACVRSNARASASLVEIPKSPYLMYWRDGQGALTPVVTSDQRPSRRQDSGVAYMLNGAVYVGRVADFMEDPVFVPPNCVGVVMPSERSLDIDSPQDLDEAERILARS